MVITLDWTILQVALVLTLFLIGIGSGWKYMAIWAVGVFFALLATDAVGPKLERLINKFLGVGASFIPLFTGAPDDSVTAPAIDIPSPDLPLWQIGFLLLVALPVAIIVARRFGNMIGVGLLGKFWGGVFGSLGAILLLGKLTEYWRTWVTAPGHSDPLANFNLSLTPTLQVPTIVIGGPSTTFNWGQLAGLAIVLILALIIGYAFWRAVRVIF
jgi:hypothetical protein